MSCFPFSDLKLDAERDLRDTGLPDFPVVALNQLPYGTIKLDRGVIFVTYSSLTAKASGGRSRLQQLVQWCSTQSNRNNSTTAAVSASSNPGDGGGGAQAAAIEATSSAGIDGEVAAGKRKSGSKPPPRKRSKPGAPKAPPKGASSFEGLLLFDESHKAKGASGGSRTGCAVGDLQTMLPNARVVYCSATGVSEPRHLSCKETILYWAHLCLYIQMVLLVSFLPQLRLILVAFVLFKYMCICDF